jgi:hypothetical protein
MPFMRKANKIPILSAAMRLLRGAHLWDAVGFGDRTFALSLGPAISPP